MKHIYFTQGLIIGGLITWAATVFGYYVRNETLKDYRAGLVDCLVKDKHE